MIALFPASDLAEGTGWARHWRSGQTWRRRHCAAWRPEGIVDHRYAWAWLHAAIRPGTDEAFALVIPEGSAAAMQAFLAGFAAILPKGMHAALLLDGAGRHAAHTITIPANISLIFLPPYAPELNPVERIWLYLRERFLSLRLFANLGAIIEG